MLSGLTHIPHYFLQPLRLFQTYERRNLRSELIAGLTVAVILLPQAIAFALIAELPPQMGLYAAIIGAVALEASGNADGYTSAVLRDAMLVGGAYAVKSGFDKASETAIHKAAIEELDDSFSSEARPMVVDVEGETHQLTGSAEVQYTKWRDLLKRIYSSETGL